MKKLVVSVLILLTIFASFAILSKDTSTILYVKPAEASPGGDTIDVSAAVRITSSGNSSGDGFYERDPQLLIASNGIWYVAYLKSQTLFTHGDAPDDLKYDAYVKTSSDSGATWSAETKVLDAAAIDWYSDFRGVTICEADGKIWVIGANVKNLEGDIYANTYSGGAWSGQHMIFDGTYSTGAFHLDSIVEGNDIRLFYGIQQDPGPGVGFIKYHSSNHTWDNTVTKIGASAGYQIPRVIKAGSTYYMVSTNWDHILFTKTTTPDIVPWPSATVIFDAPPGGAACDPTILKYGNSSGTDDLIVFSSPSYSDNSQPIEYVYSTDAGTIWTSPLPFTNAAHGTEVSWDMMSRAYLKDPTTIMLFYGMEQRGVNRGQGDILVCQWGISSTIGNKHYTTIQDGIDAANPGDTIIVDSGTYHESQILINKPLNLTGMGADTTIIDGDNAPLSDGGLVRVTASTGDVVFSGFTLRNAGPTASGDRFGIYASSSLAGPTYTISYNKIIGTNTDDSGDYGFYTHGGKESLVFTHNIITETGSNQVLIEQHPGSTDISYNTLEAGLAGADTIFYMAYSGLSVTTLQEVRYNTFDLGTNPEYATGVDFTSPAPTIGSLPSGKYTNMLISGNTFNNLLNDGWAICFWNEGPDYNLVSPTVIGNTVNGVAGSTESAGIGFIGNTTNATITQNTISGVEKAILLYSGSAPNTEINYNNIAGNAMGLDWSLGSGEVDARFNWWGDPTGPYNSELNPSGKGDEASDNVDFEPWLIEPYPPATPVEASLYIDPATVEYLTPSYGKTFTINVKIENVANLFGYAFKLYWNTTLLDLTNVQIIWPSWPHYFVGKNETNEALGMYWIGVTLLGIPAFNGTTTLAKLTFRITHDPIYPETETCKLHLADTILTSIDGGKEEDIYHMIHDGAYSINSVEPEITIASSPVEVRALGETASVDIFINDVVDLYQFSFKLSYNTTILDVVSVDFDFLNSPFVPYYEIHENDGYVYVWAFSYGTAKPANGTGLLVSITMKATKASIWPDPPLTCGLHLYETQLKTKENVQLLHTVADGAYIYQPKPGDLNADGKVNLVDLRLVAAYYDPSYKRIADLNRDGFVDIRDLSIVAFYYEE